MLSIGWEVDDGYCGKSRPQTTQIDEQDLEGMTKEEARRYIEERVQNDFNEKIQWFFTDYGLEDFEEWEPSLEDEEDED